MNEIVQKILGTPFIYKHPECWLLQTFNNTKINRKLSVSIETRTFLIVNIILKLYNIFL